VTISENLSLSATSGLPVQCRMSNAKKHPSGCLCGGTGYVIACGPCEGSGWDPKKQEACGKCGGRGGAAAHGSAKR
jgi:hypothetical protein